MLFRETPLKGAFVIEVEPVADERGFFARTFCMQEFERMGLNSRVAQCNISHNSKTGTLRGLHYQTAPYEETKLVSCFSGRIYDVIVDLRVDSNTYRHWFGMEITSEKHTMLYIPEGFAHGFQTLEDDSVVFYQMSEFYHAENSRGVRWDDPLIGISWPLADPVISDRDKGFKLLDPA